MVNECSCVFGRMVLGLSAASSARFDSYCKPKAVKSEEKNACGKFEDPLTWALIVEWQAACARQFIYIYLLPELGKKSTFVVIAYEYEMRVFNTVPAH